jgi:hypothetical protein
MTELERDMKERIERLLKRQGAGATCEDRQFDEFQPEGCKGAVTTTVIRTILSERVRAHCLI